MDFNAICNFIIYCSTMLTLAFAADSYGQDDANGDGVSGFGRSGRGVAGVAPDVPEVRIPRTDAPEPTGDRGGSPRGGGVRTLTRDLTASAPSGARVAVPGQAFEPARLKPVKYGTVPDVKGVKLTLSGPMKVSAFLESLSVATSWNIVSTPAAGEVSLQFWLTNLTPGQAVEVLKYNGLYYRFDPKAKFLYVMTLNEHLDQRYGRIDQREFTVRFADLSDVEVVFDALKSPKGQIVSVPRSAKLIVFDTAANLDFMQRALEAIDRPRDAKVITLRYVNAEFVADSIESLLSERGELRVDPRSNAIIVIDRERNTAQIASVIKILDRELETRTWTLDYADAEEVAERIEHLIPPDMGSISVNESLRQVSAKATPYRLAEIDLLIQEWDQKRRQVQIEAYLLAASRNVVRNLGVRWAFFGSQDGEPLLFQFGNANPNFNSPPSEGQRLSIGQLPGVQVVLDPITGVPITGLSGAPVISGFTGSDLSVVIDYLETEGDVTVLAHPRVTVQDGEEAIFENTTSVPYAQATELISVNRDGDLISVTRIEFIDVGTILRVKPRISSDDNILLDVISEESTFRIVSVRAADLVNDVPETTQNKAETKVLVHDQETIVIGGLRTSNFSDNVDKVPLLGDIPLLGRLFRSSSKRHDHTELLIFITPTIVDEGTQPEAIRLARFDEELAETMRYDRLKDTGKIRSLMSGGKDVIAIAIGQRGDLYVEGEAVQIKSLAERIERIRTSSTREAVIRSHPRAPKKVKAKVTDTLTGIGLDFSFDDVTVPFVPRVPAQ